VTRRARRAYLNPVVVEGGRVVAEEGRLAARIFADVARAEYGEAQDRTHPCAVAVHLLARVFQHEIDHLTGSCSPTAGEGDARSDQAPIKKEGFPEDVPASAAAL
jgi:peptide deformylase